MIDEAFIQACAGDGGRGAVSFHREKFVPKGGPDGGTGGRGGHVMVMASAQLNTLRRYRHQRIFRAQSGRPGSRNNRHGRDGEDLILEVPVGTIVSSAAPKGGLKEIIADLCEDGASVVVARGGHGGHGNTYFKSPANRAPRVAQKGQRGEAPRLRLELRLIADVGLVGLPNAGKSTLLRQLTAARPRVAAFPFTTLEPHLGVAWIEWDELVVADLPGLIEGASQGVGLGHDFLRHISRTRLLIHIIDGGSDDPWRAYELVNRELVAYREALLSKPQIVAINKIDRDEVRAQEQQITAIFAAANIKPHFISAATAEGTKELIERCAREVQALGPAVLEPESDAPRVLRPALDPRRFWVEEEQDGAFRVSGRQIEAFVEMMETENDVALEEVYRWLDRRGVSAALRRAGLKEGDTVRIGEAEWAWEG